MARMRWVPASLLATALGCAPLLRAADCNRNAVEDFAEIVSGASPDCNANGIPDECDVLPVNYGLRRTGEIAALRPGPSSLLLEDLDGDGHLDLAMIHDLDQGALSVHWNNGRGALGEGLRIGDMAFPRALTTGDVYGGTPVDLVVAHPGGISIHPKAAGRRFGVRQVVPLEFDPVAVATGDLDGDGDLELVAAGSFLAAVLENTGGGIFLPGETFVMGSNPVAAVVADLDRDGDLDLATGNALENITVLRNRGNGTFAAARNYAAGGPVIAMKAAELNGDGATDIAVVTANGHVSVLFNRRDASFAAPVGIPASPHPAALEVADLDQDGDLDLAATDEVEGVFILLSHGGGRFTPAFRFDAARASASLVAGNLNRDGWPDVLAARSQGTIEILSAEEIAYSSDCNRDRIPDECQVAANDCNRNSIPDDCDLMSGGDEDCNNNGVPDDCEADCNNNGVPDDCDLALGVTGDCNANGIPDSCDLVARDLIFEEGTIFLDQGVRSLRAGDFDGDADTDLAAIVTGGVLLLLQVEGKSFQVRDASPDPPRASSLAAGDLDGDRDLDLAAGTGTEVSVLLNRGGGTFAAPGKFPAGAIFNCLETADLDGDGDLDLAADQRVFAGAAVLLNDGKGAFGPPAAYSNPPGPGPVFVLIADFNGDRFPELALRGNERRTVALLRNLRNGTFGDPAVIHTPQEPQAGAVADMNADGHLDLVLTGANGTVFIHLGDGRGGFPEILEHGLGALSGLTTFAVGDLNHDGSPDLAIAVATDSFQREVVAFFNNGDGRFSDRRTLSTHDLLLAHRILAFDADGDGDTDLALAERIQLLDVGDASQVTLLLNRSTSPLSRDHNHNRVPDECERSLFRRGDPTGNGAVDLSDPIQLLNLLFLGGGTPGCLETADANNDARVDISDSVQLLDFLFLGGAPPPEPGPHDHSCGADPDPPGSRGDLGCLEYPPCR